MTSNRIPTHDVIHKKVYAGIWINRALMLEARFHDTTLKDATVSIMRLYRIHALYWFASTDRKLLTSKHPVALMLRHWLNLPEIKSNEMVPFRMPLDQPPDWLFALPVEQMIGEDTITDPFAPIMEGIRPEVYISPHYRLALTQSALRHPTK